MQENINDNFYYLLDDMAIGLYNIYYNKNYYTMYEEIAAVKYGLKKTEEKFKKYPEFYKKVEGKIKIEKTFNKINKNAYDMQKTVNNIHYLLKIKSDEENIFKTIFSHKYFYMLYNPEDITYKSLNELRNDPEWNKLSLEIRCLIVSSESYLSEVDFFSITKEEIEFLINALIYNYELEKKKYRSNRYCIIKLKNLTHSKDLKEILNEEIEENLLCNREKMAKIKLQIEKLKIILSEKTLKKTKKLY